MSDSHNKQNGVASPMQISTAKDNNDDIEMGDLSMTSKDTTSSTLRAITVPLKKVFPSLIGKFCSYDKRTQFELIIFVCCTVALFGVAINYFLQQSITTLVPFQSVSQCSTSQAMYSFSEQNVFYNYPMALKFVDYDTGYTTPGIATAKFAASWHSCGGNSLNASSFGLVAGKETTLFVPLNVAIHDAISGSFQANISSNDGCFAVTCGFTYNYTHGNRSEETQLQSFQNNTLIEIVPINPNNILTIDNDTLILSNSQLMLSIAETENSVSAQCVIGIAGTLNFVLSEANSVSSSGTYLCTTKTTAFQSLSSSLSLCLSFIGASKIYFMIKRFYSKAPKMDSSYT